MKYLSEPLPTSPVFDATDAQLDALRHVFERAPLAWCDPNRGPAPGERAMTWNEFRALVEPGPGCLMVPWLRMWVGIEPDGYTHT